MIFGTSLNDNLTGTTLDDQLFGLAGNDTVDGGDGNDQIFGNSGNDSLLGGSGNDFLYGGLGNDTLDGGLGNDTLDGGRGNDTYIIDSTTDTIIEIAYAGIDTVQSSITYTLGANLENLTLTGLEAINGTGNTLNNRITGNSANNTLDAGAGNDTLDGGLGIDTLIGGTGNDTYIIDSTDDTIIENANAGIDTVQSSVSYTLGDNLENLTLTGFGAINGTGNILNNVITGNYANNTLNGLDGNDSLVGGYGNDTLIGGDGNDVLAGGAGNDLLIGGNGDDRFLFDSGTAFHSYAFGIDTINDFTLGIDTIVLDKTSFTALTSIAGNGFSVASEFAVVGSDAEAATSSALIVYDSTNGNLFYNQNGTADGFGTGAQFATLTDSPLISGSDFVIQA